MLKNLLRAGVPVALAALSLAPTGPAHAVEGPGASSANPCATVVAPLGSVCVPAPKQCFTTPCYQYDIVPVLSAPWPPARSRTA